MRHLLLCLLLSGTVLAQPRVEELSKPEEEQLSKAFGQAVFPGHECIGLIHMVRLVRVNGRVHGLALHQVNRHAGTFTWTHYVQEGASWKERGKGLPDPAAGDDHIVVPEPSAEEIKANFRDLVKGLELQKWSRPAQQQLLDPERFLTVD